MPEVIFIQILTAEKYVTRDWTMDTVQQAVVSLHINMIIETFITHNIKTHPTT
jgi:hypothetical protein